MNKKALVAEFIGTFALIFIGVGAIAADQLTGGKVGVTGIALAHGFAIAVMVSATAVISGGHLNPAVTLALWTIKKIDAKSAVVYIVVQCLGAIAAAAVLRFVFPLEVISAVHVGTPALAEGVSYSMGLVTEIVLTFFLVIVIMGTAVDKRAPQCGGLFIGLAVAMDVLMGGPLTGAAMNPARYLGPAMINGGFANCGVYWFGPVIGGVLAAFTYKYVLLEKSAK